MPSSVKVYIKGQEILRYQITLFFCFNTVVVIELYKYHKI